MVECDAREETTTSDSIIWRYPNKRRSHNALFEYWVWVVRQFGSELRHVFDFMIVEFGFYGFAVIYLLKHQHFMIKMFLKLCIKCLFEK